MHQPAGRRRRAARRQFSHVRIPAVRGARRQDKEPNLTHAFATRDAPNYVVDAISVRARDERGEEEKREMRVEALPDWLEIYLKGGAAVFRLLRSILPDRMIPSLYQLDHFKETLALK